MKLRSSFRSEILVTLFLMGFAGCSSRALGDDLTVYPAVSALPLSPDFTVRVRTSGGSWTPVPVYNTPVSTGIDVQAAVQAADRNSVDQARSFHTQFTSFANVDFTGTLEVEIAWQRGELKTARIRPLSYGISPQVEGNTIRFTLARPRNLSVEVNSDIFHNLQLFAGEIQTPPKERPGMVSFGPGVHDIGTVNVPGGTTIYLAGGAVVRGAFILSHVHDVHILGRGILAPARAAQNQPHDPLPAPLASGGSAVSRRHDGILIEYSSDISVEGITELAAGYSVLIGQSDGVQIRDLKSFSAGGNNDGIDVFSSRNVAIDGVYMRNSDDCIAIYGHRWAYYGDLENVSVRNSTLWADVAHPILIGTHGDPEKPETLGNLVFQNIDILDQREPQLDYQGAMAINAGDANLIEHVRFDNIRVEDLRLGQLFNLRVFFNRKYNTAPGRGIHDVVFSNVQYNGAHANPSIIAGYDDQRGIRNVVFEGLRINGVSIADDMAGKPSFYKSSDIANIFVGEHVDGVIFRRSPQKLK